MPIKSVTSNQAEIKMSNTPLIFRICNCIFIFQYSNVFLFNVGNKVFCFFKNESFLFRTRVHFKGGKISSPKFLGGLLIKGGGGLIDLEFGGWG